MDMPERILRCKLIYLLFGKVTKDARHACYGNKRRGQQIVCSVSQKALQRFSKPYPVLGPERGLVFRPDDICLVSVA